MSAEAMTRSSLDTPGSERFTCECPLGEDRDGDGGLSEDEEEEPPSNASASRRKRKRPRRRSKQLGMKRSALFVPFVAAAAAYSWAPFLRAAAATGDIERKRKLVGLGHHQRDDVKLLADMAKQMVVPPRNGCALVAHPERITDYIAASVCISIRAPPAAGESQLAKAINELRQRACRARSL